MRNQGFDSEFWADVKMVALLLLIFVVWVLAAFGIGGGFK